jgi:Tol biopolymer transport system component
MFSADGKSVAFIRDDRGRGQLLLREQLNAGGTADRALTPPSLNVYEASFLSVSSYAFAAANPGEQPQIYLTDAKQSNAPLALGEARFPALSPNGAWLAYSRMEKGVWNLWIRDEKTGATRRIVDVQCNEVQPSWMSDSKTLLYSTDCGRSLWFIAIARRRVIP